MKTKLLTVIFCLFVSVVFSQEHLKFKGIPINGNISAFTSELVKLGFKLEGTDQTINTFSGDFVNNKCTIFIVASKKSKVVWKVKAFLPKDENWYSLKQKYYNLKKEYTEKYGIGESYEYFSKPYYEGDSYEMQALELEKCTYSTYFETANGTICVEISKFKQIAISYEDKINSDLDELEKKASISNDI